MFDTTTPMSTAVLHKLDKKWTPEGFFKGLKMEEKILYGHASLYYTDIIGDHTMFPTKSTTTTTKYISSSCLHKIRNFLILSNIRVSSPAQYFLAFVLLWKMNQLRCC